MAMPPRSNEARFPDPPDEEEEDEVDYWDNLRGIMLRGDHLLTYGRPLEERRRIADFWIPLFQRAESGEPPPE